MLVNSQKDFKIWMIQENSEILLIIYFLTIFLVILLMNFVIFITYIMLYYSCTVSKIKIISYNFVLLNYTPWNTVGHEQKHYY